MFIRCWKRIPQKKEERKDREIETYFILKIMSAIYFYGNYSRYKKHNNTI